jgi:hypothetical protein
MRREHVVEAELVEQIEALGGECQKLDSKGRKGRCDRVVSFYVGSGCSLTWFVEVKSVTGVVRDEQKREHSRLAGRGHRVAVLRGMLEVDMFISQVKREMIDAKKVRGTRVSNAYS